MIHSEPEVKIIADSVSPEGVRLTTFQLRYWRPIHPEMLTHRAFSRNARSSRATPIDVMVEQVLKEPWGPRHWTINGPGMVAQTEFSDSMQINAMELLWKSLAEGPARLVKQIADMSKQMGGATLHKQILNRILEPFTYIDVVLSATDFKNFFTLRTDKNAQPEMQDLAKAMLENYNSSLPIELKETDWHLPYISLEDRENYSLEDCKKMSVARCARVSYKPFDEDTANPQKDIELFDKLLENKHMSAFEHVACPAPVDGYLPSNFRGWNQFRKFMPDECQAETKFEILP